jgi:hypothetical protein
MRTIFYIVLTILALVVMYTISACGTECGTEFDPDKSTKAYRIGEWENRGQLDQLDLNTIKGTLLTFQNRGTYRIDLHITFQIPQVTRHTVEIGWNQRNPNTNMDVYRWHRRLAVSHSFTVYDLMLCAGDTIRIAFEGNHEQISTDPDSTFLLVTRTDSL